MAPRSADFGPSSLALDMAVEPGSVVATFLYARLHGFSAVCQAMGSEDAAAFVTEVRRMLTDVVAKLGGEVAQRRPDSILAVFSNKQDERKPNHAQRGLHAAILAVHEAVQLAQALASRPHFAGLPPLTIAAGVHLGPAEVKLRGKGGNGMVHAVGEAVEVARMLEVTATDLHWSVATSAATRLAAAGRAHPNVGHRAVQQRCPLNQHDRRRFSATKRRTAWLSAPTSAAGRCDGGAWGGSAGHWPTGHLVGSAA
jgi:class 3 adenylate cyclase